MLGYQTAMTHANINESCSPTHASAHDRVHSFIVEVATQFVSDHLKAVTDLLHWYYYDP